MVATVIGGKLRKTKLTEVRDNRPKKLALRFSWPYYVRSCQKCSMRRCLLLHLFEFRPQVHNGKEKILRERQPHQRQHEDPPEPIASPLTLPWTVGPHKVFSDVRGPSNARQPELHDLDSFFSFQTPEALIVPAQNGDRRCIELSAPSIRKPGR